MNKRKIGNEYESIACEYLESNGYTILDRNFRCKIGEIDIIAKNDNYVCFIEVKYRDENSLAPGYMAVDKKKQMTIYNVARCYLLQKYNTENIDSRFDVVSIDGKKITLFKNAYYK